MTNLELLQAATPGVWIADGCAKVEVQAHDICSVVTPYGKNYEEAEANAKLLSQAKVSALLVECAARGWKLLVGNGTCHLHDDEWFTNSFIWPGAPHEMLEEVFNAVLAELAGAK